MSQTTKNISRFRLESTYRR